MPIVTPSALLDFAQTGGVCLNYLACLIMIDVVECIIDVKPRGELFPDGESSNNATLVGAISAVQH